MAAQEESSLTDNAGRLNKCNQNAKDKWQDKRREQTINTISTKAEKTKMVRKVKNNLVEA